MQYIILCGGKGTRWNNYFGITKQEIVLNNETILERTVRLIKEYQEDKIYVLSRNENHEITGTTRIISNYDDYFRQKYAYNFLNEPTIFLYGDTFYSEEAIKDIIESEITDVMFYGNSTAIVGLKVENIDLFKFVLNIPSERKSLYHKFDGFDNVNRFTILSSFFKNINTPEDYITLKMQIENNDEFSIKKRCK